MTRRSFARSFRRVSRSVSRTGFRRKQSGNTRAVLEQRQRFHLAMMNQSWVSMRGSRVIQAASNTPTRSARRSPTRGACTTCTATCLNGARIGMTSLCRVAQIQLAPTTAPPACFAAAAGGATLATVGRRTATAPSRRSAAPWVSVWPAVSRFSDNKRRQEVKADAEA